MIPADFDWKDYYSRVSGHQPRPLAVEVVERFGQDTPATARQAIDLGCGTGEETIFLLAHGWHVLAIDREAAAFEHLTANLPPEAQERLETQVASFEAAALAPADLIYAGYSLPFCPPRHFDALWRNIVTHINPGGRFAGQLFGMNDSWAAHPDMTFLTQARARALFDGFEIEHFQEEDADGESTLGPKHWHIFHAIARKR
jgi:tellurite methyltransferase